MVVVIVKDCDRSGPCISPDNAQVRAELYYNGTIDITYSTITPEGAPCRVFTGIAYYFVVKTYWNLCFKYIITSIIIINNIM